MVYDPQRDQPRHGRNGRGPAIVDSLLDPVGESPQTSDDRSPEDAGEPAMPEPAQAWTERLLYSVGLSTVLSAAAGLVTLRLLWRFWKRRAR